MGPPDYFHVGSCPLGALSWEDSGPLLAQFHADGGGGNETGSENGGQCTEGKDNDGDAKIDCGDPDCANTKWCP
jgi:hypothetical protein